MEEVVVPIVVALITVGVPGYIAIRRFRRENSEQHSQSYGLLQSLDTRLGHVAEDVSEVKEGLDRHLGWHSANDDLERRP